MDTWVVPGYREERVLGAGDTGRVVLATYLPNGAYVAIKYLTDGLRGDPEFLTAFRAEARVLVELDHPHIVRLHEYVETVAGAALVMELIDGISLRRLLDEHGPLGPEASLAVLKAALLALSAAHASGIVHRDPKPENVLVQADGTAKLTDFGVAARSPGPGRPAGTPAYLAPEQWDGAPERWDGATPATDLYAATCVFFECLTGHRPYRDDHPAALMRRHRDDPIPLVQVPVAVRGLVARGMAKNPADRPTTARAFLAELETTALEAYGPEWEQRGRRSLAELATRMALQFPLADPPPRASGATAWRPRDRTAGLLGRLREPGPRAAIGAGTLAAAITVALLLSVLRPNIVLGGDEPPSSTITPTQVARPSTGGDVGGGGERQGRPPVLVPPTSAPAGAETPATRSPTPTRSSTPTPSATPSVTDGTGDPTLTPGGTATPTPSVTSPTPTPAPIPSVTPTPSPTPTPTAGPTETPGPSPPGTAAPTEPTDPDEPDGTAEPTDPAGTSTPSASPLPESPPPESPPPESPPPQSPPSEPAPSASITSPPAPATSAPSSGTPAEGAAAGTVESLRILSFDGTTVTARVGVAGSGPVTLSVRFAQGRTADALSPAGPPQTRTLRGGATHTVTARAGLPSPGCGTRVVRRVTVATRPAAPGGARTELAVVAGPPCPAARVTGLSIPAWDGVRATVTVTTDGTGPVRLLARVTLARGAGDARTLATAGRTLSGLTRYATALTVTAPRLRCGETAVLGLTVATVPAAPGGGVTRTARMAGPRCEPPRPWPPS